MLKRQDVVIRAVRNGFMVEPTNGMAAKNFAHAGTMVFDSMDRLLDWLEMHFTQTGEAAEAMAQREAALGSVIGAAQPGEQKRAALPGAEERDKPTVREWLQSPRWGNAL